MKVLVPVYLDITQIDESGDKHNTAELLQASADAVLNALTMVGNEMGFWHGLDETTEISDLHTGDAVLHPEGCITGAQVEAEHGEEHPEWPREEWRDDVANEDTRLGYYDWVAHQLNQPPNEDEEENQA